MSAVIDASVAAKWFFPTAGSLAAIRILEGNEVLIAPAQDRAVRAFTIACEVDHPVGDCLSTQPMTSARSRIVLRMAIPALRATVALTAILKAGAGQLSGLVSATLAPLRILSMIAAAIRWDKVVGGDTVVCEQSSLCDCSARRTCRRQTRRCHQGLRVRPGNAVGCHSVHALANRRLERTRKVGHGPDIGEYRCYAHNERGGLGSGFIARSARSQ
ncbi:MAG: type II toxin-antitoxin system VapC family toxin [Alphaproteobacteria bacterium]|nr:type II toxin-antitoxin system VapC family toxin [Alphaproteobacteria bacterium]